jgi:hypothetical protein
MNVPRTHLLEYLGAEETNLLVSMNLCKRDTWCAQSVPGREGFGVGQALQGID